MQLEQMDLAGGSCFFFMQLVAVVNTFINEFIFSYLMLILINKITPVKVSDVEEDIGLGDSLHGENTYVEGVL